MSSTSNFSEARGHAVALLYEMAIRSQSQDGADAGITGIKQCSKL
jgi:hypothetical protein